MYSAWVLLSLHCLHQSIITMHKHVQCLGVTIPSLFTPKHHHYAQACTVLGCYYPFTVYTKASSLCTSMYSAWVLLSLHCLHQSIITMHKHVQCLGVTIPS